jgi:hypothetical protein
VALLSTQFVNWRATSMTQRPAFPLSRTASSFNKVGVSRYFISMPDVNRNGYPELAVAKANASGATGRVQIKDATTSAPLRNFAYPSTGFTNRGLAAIADLNGNSSPEVVVPQHRKSNDVMRVRVHDARTRAIIRHHPRYHLAECDASGSRGP